MRCPQAPPAPLCAFKTGTSYVAANSMKPWVREKRGPAGLALFRLHLLLPLFLLLAYDVNCQNETISESWSAGIRAYLRHNVPALAGEQAL